MAQSVVVSGAKVVLYINGTLFARVTNFSWSSETPRRPIYGIDSSVAYELVPTQVRVTAQIGLFKTLADGGVEAAGMTGNVLDLLREQYFTIMLVDLVTDSVLFRADRCLVLSQNWSAPSRSIVTGNVSVQCLDWQNEVEPSLVP